MADDAGIFQQAERTPDAGGPSISIQQQPQSPEPQSQSPSVAGDTAGVFEQPEDLRRTALQARESMLAPGEGAPADVRTVASFARTAEQRDRILKNYFGEQNVIRIGEGEFAFRTGPDQPFQRVDENRLTIRDFLDLLGQAPEAIGGAVGGITGGVPGAAAGGAVGAGVTEGVRAVTGIEEDPNLAESAKRMAIAGGTEAIGEGVGGALTKGLKRTAAPFRETIEQASEPAQKILQEVGEELTPAQRTSSRVLDLAENISEASLVGGGVVAKRRASQKEAITKLEQNLLDGFGKELPREDVGQLFINTIEQKEDAATQAARAMFDQVDSRLGSEFDTVTRMELVPSDTLVDEFGRPALVPRIFQEEVQTGGARVNLMSLKTYAMEELQRRGKAPKALTGGTGQSLLEQVMSLPDSTTFENAQFMRSELLKLRSAPGEPSGVANKIASAMSKRIDTAMEKAGNALDVEAKALWREANAFWKRRRETFNNKFIQRVKRQLQEEPELIAKALIKPGRTTGIRRAKAIVGTETWNKVQRAFLEDVFTRARNLETGQTKGTTLQSVLTKQVSRQTTESVLGKEATNRLFSIAEASVRIGARQAEGAGTQALRIIQGGALIGLAAGGLQEGAATVFIGPAILARLMMNPRAAKLLVEGVNLPAGSPQAISTMTRLLAQVSRESHRANIEEAQRRTKGGRQIDLTPRRRSRETVLEAAPVQ